MLVACHGRDNLGTVLIEENKRYYIIETIDDTGHCLAYRTAKTLQDAWQEFDVQKGMVK
jgi:hypothetical protein